MSGNMFDRLTKSEERDEYKNYPSPEHVAARLALLLAYLEHLRVPRQSSQLEINTLRLLIVVIGLVLVVVALVSAGSADQVADVLRHWPLAL